MRHVIPRPCAAGISQYKSSLVLSEKKSPEESSEKKSLPEESPQKEKLPMEVSEKEKLPEITENSEIPWNLRKRRTYDKNDSCVGFVNGVKEGKRKLFSVSLLAKEIEADFLRMNGKKPHRWPKKRPKHVQKQIDELFPGMYVSEITPDLYKVEEEN